MAERAYHIDSTGVGDDEAVPLRAAARIFFPAGGVTERFLRKEIYRGHLASERIGGKLFVTKRYLEAMEAAQPAPGKIYFLRCGSFVKIGFTNNLERRIGTLSDYLPGPPKLLLTRCGAIGDERALHRRFAELRSHREWFRLDGKLRDFLRSEGCDV